MGLSRRPCSEAVMRTPALASLSILLFGALALSACSSPEAPPAPPIPEVSVVTLSTEPVSLSRELDGRTVPFLVAEVRPQVTGIVKQRAFTEGARVEAGDALYQIDDASYRAARDSARAALARAEASLNSTRLSANRAAELAEKRLLSAQDNELAAASYQQAQADVAAARAQLQAAEVTLGYASLVAPISGRIGKSSVTQGALVTANQAEALATIQQLDPIYIDLAQSSSELLELRREVAAGTLEQADGVPVTILLEDGSAYAQQGRLQFADVTVDPRTGSYALRVLVPNPDGLLLPGMYVRAQVDMGQRPQGLLAPQQAITRDPKGQAVAMVVNAEGVVEARVLSASRTQGDQWLVDEGLQAGDRVIVEGLQKIKPGAHVRVIEAGTAAPQQAPAAATASVE
jgi:membrane fusion protein (multidrug efflux system)